DAVGLLSQILSGEVAPLRKHCPDVSEEIEAVVTRCLAKKAADRFPTIDEAADAIEPFAEAAPAPGRRDSGMPTSGAGARMTEGVETAAGQTVGTPAVRALRRTARVGVAILASIGGLLVLVLVVAALRGWIHIDPGAKDAIGPVLVVESLGCEP